MVWQYIDAVLVINLDDSRGRWEQLMLHLDGLVPREKLHRISAVRGTELPGYLQKPWFSSRTGSRARTCAGAAGCVLSHAKTLRYALEHPDWNVILVLEDDCRFDAERLNRLASQMLDFMHHYPAWELLYAGYHGEPQLAGDLETGWDFFNIYRCSGVLGTFAMLLHRRAWQEIMRRLPDEKHVWAWIAQYKAIDYWLQRWFTPFHEVFYVTPPFCSSAEGLVSDISGKVVVPVKKAFPAWHLDDHEWQFRYSLFRRFMMWGNMQCDRLIRLIFCLVRGFSGRNGAGSLM